MQRISVDFNTMMADPDERVTLGQFGTPNGDWLPPLISGERVLLYDEEMEVEAVAEFDAEHRFWLAAPDWSTRRDLTPTPS
ncbi:MAG TPA: hypothetical protein VFU88_01315 [Ktedonobacterales bacterium]|nr:hypothetical protein [Ktedonobacterales bacterium]